jgi:hypothetical protein
MKRRIAATALAFASAAWILAGPRRRRADNKELSQTSHLSGGRRHRGPDGRVVQRGRRTGGLDLVYYDRKEQNIVTYVVGSAEDVPGAKRELEAFVSAVREYVVPYAKGQHGMEMTDKDVTLIYYNDGGDSSPYEVVRRENGVYKTAPPPSGDDRE